MNERLPVIVDFQTLTSVADFIDGWTWNRYDKSPNVILTGENGRTAFFHPKWSNGSAGIRATQPLPKGVTYWEIRVSKRLFGTSLMFGIATKQARLHANTFRNLLGEDGNGWGLSHKGDLFHNGQQMPYTQPFAENKATTVGILFDSELGTLTYFKDGVDLGLAFSGLHKVNHPLYPAIYSTAARTEMTLLCVRHYFISLQIRCRWVILSLTGDVAEKVNQLPLPPCLLSFLKEPFLLDKQVKNKQIKV